MIKRKLLLPALIASTFLLGCQEAKLQQNNFVPVVTTETASLIQYYPENIFVGRIEAVEDVSLIAQVSGYLKHRYFTEGEMVVKGQKLFQIDPSVYEAKVSQAKAALSQAKANFTRTNLDWKRGKDLLAKGGISQSEYDHLTAAKRQALAGVQSAEAQLIAAEVDLSHTLIVAPFSGRISQSKVSIGDLISPSSGVLTTIVSLDPIHASFSMSEKQRLLLGADQVAGNGTQSDQNLDVILNLGQGIVYEHFGQLDYVGNRIDTQTGTIDLRAKFANPTHRLLPGQYIEVTVREKTPHTRIVIPRIAVQTDLEGDFVMVLKTGNQVERRNVKLGEQTKDGVLIQSGLSANEQVLVKGLQRVRNGMSVQVTPAASTAIASKSTKEA